MKRKAFKELMRQGAGNLIINAELAGKKLEEDGIDTAVVRGVAYGMAFASLILGGEREEFDMGFLLAVLTCSRVCEEVYAEKGAIATVEKLFGCEVSVDE